VNEDRPEPPAGFGVPGTRQHFSTDDAVAARLDSTVAIRTGLSRTQAATLIATGQVHVNGRREKASYRLETGDAVEVDIPVPASREVLGEDIPLDIVWEDDHLVVVDKPAGMVVHPAPGNWTGTLVNALKGRGGTLSDTAGEDRQGIVHRLDKETSGLLLVAKSDRAHRSLSSAIAARRVVRRYAALSWGHLSSDAVEIDKPLARDPRDRTRMAVIHDGRESRTTVRRLARFASVELLRCELHTGRTHQIRVHLSSIGHPVVGDDVYGGGGGRRLMKLPPRRHFLHAAWLRLRHPVSGDELDFRSALPPDLRESLAAAAEDAGAFAATNPLEYFGFYSHDE